VAVDPDPARAKIADVRTVLDQIDAAFIAVPTDRHHEVALACLEKGVHLLIEKPIATTVEEADALIALAKSRGVVLQVGHVERYNPTFKALTARMDRPMFIEAERLAAFKQRGVEVDVVLDLMIHDLDLAVALAADVASVSAMFRVLTNDIDIASCAQHPRTAASPTWRRVA
jgi:predicted dehydrogenase